MFGFGSFLSGLWGKREQEEPEETSSEHNLVIKSKEFEDKESENIGHDRKRKLSSNQEGGFAIRRVKSVPNIEVSSSDSSDEETEYDLKRKRVIEEREMLLRSLGIISAKEKVKEIIDQIAKAKKKKKKGRQIKKIYALRPRKRLPLRVSLRLRGIDPEIVDPKTKLTKSVPETSHRKAGDTIGMTFSSGRSETNFNDFLLGERSCVSQQLSGPVLENDDLFSFRSRVQNLRLSPTCIRKVVKGSVTALAVHPSEHNLLVAAGDTRGNMGFWDVKSNKVSDMIQLHSQQVNHTSFSVYSSEKLISTSMDGTVRCGDLNKAVSNKIYTSTSDENNSGYHTYWHAEMSRDVLLIAHGSGEVGIFDQRKGKLSHSYKCHDGPIKTVHCNPTANNYFVSGSVCGEARIWDIRHLQKSEPRPVLNLKNPKDLTGCFFSPAGNYLLTTCTKGRLSVYDTRSFISHTQTVVMKHHGKRHSKAKWYPLREDVFIIGNLSNYKAAVYDIQGHLVHQFVDPEIQAALYECEFHPTQLAFVGGSTFGRVYAFV